MSFLGSVWKAATRPFTGVYKAINEGDAGELVKEFTIGSLDGANITGWAKDRSKDPGDEYGEEVDKLIDSAKEEGSQHLLNSRDAMYTDPSLVKIPAAQMAAMRAQQEEANRQVASQGAAALKGRSGAAVRKLSDLQQGIAADNQQSAFDNSLGANESNFKQNVARSGQNLDFITNHLNASLGLKSNEASNAMADKTWLESFFNQ